jgi:hypothetical protein
LLFANKVYIRTSTMRQLGNSAGQPGFIGPSHYISIVVIMTRSQPEAFLLVFDGWNPFICMLCELFIRLWLSSCLQLLSSIGFLDPSLGCIMSSRSVSFTRTIPSFCQDLSRSRCATLCRCRCLSWRGERGFIVCECLYPQRWCDTRVVPIMPAHSPPGVE